MIKFAAFFILNLSAFALVTSAALAAAPSEAAPSTVAPLKIAEDQPAAGPLIGPSPAPSGELKEFRDEIERDFPLRSLGQLQVTNMRGDITVQGWALDKIRVKAHRKAMAYNEDESRRLLSAVDFRHHAGSDGNVELSAQYGRGLSIEERLKERDNPRTSMAIQVFAPAKLKLSVWAVDGKVVVKNWSASAEIRTASGPITAESIKGELLSILCSDCAIDVREIRASIHVMGSSKPIDLHDVMAPKIYAESNSGPVRAQKIQGDQLYVSKSGSIAGRELKGHMEFYTQQGAVDFQDAFGFLSGRTESGDITARMREWNFRDKALIESVRGNISLTLPAKFSGDVDLWSITGKASIGFPLEKPQEGRSIGPEPASRLLGRVGSGGELLKVFSEKGDIQIRKGI